MSNQKRNTTLQALNIGLEGRAPLQITDDIQTIINDPATKVAVVGGIDPSGNIIAAQLTALGELKVNATVSATLSPGDVEIGAVELKDADTDTRVKIKTDGTDNAVVVTQNSQPLPTGAATEATLASVDAKLNSTLSSDLGVTSYNLNQIDEIFSSLDVMIYRGGSLQASWTGATSSDAFVTPGQFEIEVSNDNTNWETLLTISVDSAARSELNRGILIDFRYIRASWTQNASTGGAANIILITK